MLGVRYFLLIILWFCSLKRLHENPPSWFRELSSDHKAEDNKHQEAVVLHFFVPREPIWWKHVLWKMLFESLVSTHYYITINYVCTKYYIHFSWLYRLRNNCLINSSCGSNTECLDKMIFSLNFSTDFFLCFVPSSDFFLVYWQRFPWFRATQNFHMEMWQFFSLTWKMK